MNQETSFKPYEGGEPYIFVSYSHKDSLQVFPVLQELHNRGLRIWYDKGIDPGSEWPEEIANHLLGCGLFLLFMSPDAAESHNVRREITMAVDKKKSLMNVYLKETGLQPGLQLQLNLIQYVSYAQDKEDFDEFIERLTEILLRKAPEVKGDSAVVKVSDVKTSAIKQPAPPPKQKPKTARSALPKLLMPIYACLFIIIVLIIIFATRGPNQPSGGEDVSNTVSPDISSESETAQGVTTQPANANAQSKAQPASVNATTVGDNYYVTLTGTGSLEFTNIFPDKVSMPVSVAKVKINYTAYDKDGKVTEYRASASNIGSNLESGCKIVISLANPSESTDFYFPSSLLDVAITVNAFDAPAIKFLTLTGSGSLEFINITAGARSIPDTTDSTKRDYAIYDKDGKVADYKANSSYRETLSPGSRAVISLSDSSQTLTFFYPTDYEDTVFSMKAIDTRALKYVQLTGAGSVEFTNISTEARKIPDTTDSTKRDYVIYDKDGSVKAYEANSSSRETLYSGSRAVITLSNSSQTLTFFYPTDDDDTVFSVKTLDTQALKYVQLTGTESVEFINISSEAVKVPKTTYDTERDYVIYDKDMNVTDNGEKSNNRYDLKSGFKTVISLSYPSDTLNYFYPADWEDTVFSVTLNPAH